MIKEKKISNRNKFFDKIIKSPERSQHVLTMFSEIAPRYDVMNRIMSLGLDLYWRRLAIKKANFNKGSSILDIGIGTGDMAREVIRQISDTNVVGLDNCPELVKWGQSKKAIKSVKWTIGDGRQLPFSDNSVDGVVAAFSIRNIPDLSFVFSEIYRVIAPGGKIVILDMVKPNSYLFNKIFKFYFKYIIPKLGKLVGSDPEAYTYLLPSIEHFYSSRELQNKLQSLGCSKIFTRDLMFQTVTICIYAKDKVNIVTDRRCCF